MSLIKDLIAPQLFLFGWEPVAGSAIAQKHFATAVGEKTAFAYLGDLGPASGHLMLMGDYWSEGRNCLDSGLVLIPKESTYEDIQALVKTFATHVDQAVRQSYAVKVLYALGATCLA